MDFGRAVVDAEAADFVEDAGDQRFATVTAPCPPSISARNRSTTRQIASEQITFDIDDSVPPRSPWSSSQAQYARSTGGWCEYPFRYRRAWKPTPS